MIFCICVYKCSASYTLIKDNISNDQSNAKALVARIFHKCFLQPSGEYEKAFLREEGGPRSSGRSPRDFELGYSPL